MALGEFSNDTAGFQALERAVQTAQGSTGAAQAQWVVEPTGGYELSLVTFAHDQNWPINLPNPRQVRQWAQGTGHRAKTAP